MANKNHTHTHSRTSESPKTSSRRNDCNKESIVAVRIDLKITHTHTGSATACNPDVTLLPHPLSFPAILSLHAAYQQTIHASQAQQQLQNDLKRKDLRLLRLQIRVHGDCLSTCIVWQREMHETFPFVYFVCFCCTCLFIPFSSTRFFFLDPGIFSSGILFGLPGCLSRFFSSRTEKGSI